MWSQSGIKVQLGAEGPREAHNVPRSTCTVIVVAVLGQKLPLTIFLPFFTLASIIYHLPDQDHTTTANSQQHTHTTTLHCQQSDQLLARKTMFLFRKLSSLKSQQHEATSTPADKDDAATETAGNQLATNNNDDRVLVTPPPPPPRPTEDINTHNLRDEDRYELV